MKAHGLLTEKERRIEDRDESFNRMMIKGGNATNSSH
jgi:hypothetical protein